MRRDASTDPPREQAASFEDPCRENVHCVSRVPNCCAKRLHWQECVVEGRRNSHKLADPVSAARFASGDLDFPFIQQISCAGAQR